MIYDLKNSISGLFQKNSISIGQQLTNGILRSKDLYSGSGYRETYETTASRNLRFQCSFDLKVGADDLFLISPLRNDCQIRVSRSQLPFGQTSWKNSKINNTNY